MSLQAKQFYEFGPFRVDPGEHLLSRNGAPLPLTPKAFETLLVLIRNSGHLMLKQELMQAVWPDSFVEEANLSQNISMLRKALGDSVQESRYIVTVPGKGYRFIGELKQPSLQAAVHETLVVEDHSRTRITVQETVTHPILLLAGVVLVLATLAAATGWWMYRPAHRSFNKVSLTKLTHDGNTRLAAISPDGRYVAYVRRETQVTVWIHQIATDSTFQLVPPLDVFYENLTYSPNGNYLYFTRARPGSVDHYDLYMVPSLGGIERRVLADVNSTLGFSPDASRMAFVRRTGDHKLSKIVVANSDGSDERVLLSFGPTEFFEGAPAWSPDGKVIAFAARQETAPASAAIILVPVDGGKTTALPASLVVTDVAWLPDGSGLLETAYENGRYFNHQIWLQPYPKGSLRRITNDLGSYLGLSVDKDGTTLVTLEQTLRGSVYVAPATDPSQLKPIATGTNNGVFLEWLRSGDLFLEDGEFHFSIAHADGSDRRPMTLREDVLSAEPSACGDGRFIVMTSLHQGHWRIFKLDTASQEIRQLTDGTLDDHPVCSTDGRSVIFDSETSAGTRLRRVSIDGGAPLPLGDMAADTPRFSPDGKLIAFWLLPNDGSSLRAQLAIMRAEGGPLLKTYEIPGEGLLMNHALMRWAPDGNAITYVLRQPDGSRFWSQALAGGPPHHLARFREPIFWYNFSADGKQIAMSSGQYVRDVVLIRSLE